MVEALTVKNAREKLAAAGILAERLHPTGRRIRFPVQHRSMVYRELSALLGAGLPLIRAFDNLLASPELESDHSLLAGIKDRLRDGLTLAAAIGESSASISAFETAIIEAAERSASVEVMLERLADFLDEQEQTREKVQTALLYPLIVLTVGVCVAILMLGLLLPRARTIMAAGNAPMPALTQFMLGLGAQLARWGLLILAALAAAGGFVRHKLRTDSRWQVRWDQALFRVPMFGRGYAILVNLRFARTLAILLRGGVSVIEGSLLAGKATGSIWVNELVRREAETVRHGGTLADALRRVPPLARSMPGWVQTGEASGSLDRLLDSAGKRCQAQWDRFVTRSLSLLEPVLILVIGGFVLLVTISVLLPILSLTKGVGR
jgi:general secretion pathway protein F